MARVTSSSNRSKRSSSKPVSSDKGRKARARVSTAKPTSSENRTRTGTAKVTGADKGKQRAQARRTEAARRTQSGRAQRLNASTKADTIGQGSGGVSKPNGRQPRAITNGNNPAMRQLRAKAIQAQRQAQGKSTVASRNQRVTPTNAAGQRIKDMARQQRVIGDSGQVRAAQAQGRKIVAQAQARRGAKAASKRMENILKGAQTARNVVGQLKSLTRGGAAAAGLQAYNTGDGTLTAAKARGDLAKRRKPTAQEAASYRAQEQAAMAKLKARKASDAAKSAKSSFDDAFKDARRAKVKTFTWRGKKYTTDMK